MSWYSHFQFKIYLRRNLTLSLWCQTLTLCTPYGPAPAPPLRKPVRQARGSLLQTAGFQQQTPACRPPPTTVTPQARLLSPLPLKPFETWREAACSLGPQLSGSWDLQTLLRTVGRAQHPKQIWERGPSCREAQNTSLLISYLYPFSLGWKTLWWYAHNYLFAFSHHNKIRIMISILLPMQLLKTAGIIFQFLYTLREWLSRDVPLSYCVSNDFKLLLFVRFYCCLSVSFTFCFYF